jgi:5,6-dimethylbenzimidazole synthase
MSKFKYSQAELEAIYRVIHERRDIRHFLSDPVDSSVLRKLLIAAHKGPSVGLMQPWRFIRITDAALRKALHFCVQEEVLRTAEAMGERAKEFMRLKVEGILQCGELIVVALPEGREKYIFGRRTLPEMDLASVACAIQNMWLAARAEGLGMGWVSIFDPGEVCELLSMPSGSHPVAILCLGHVKEFYRKPMLVTESWAEERPLDEMLYENTWG